MPAQNEVVIQVIVEPAPEAAVRVEVAGMLRDGTEQALRTVTVSSSSLSRSTARAVFESGISGLVAGTWDFSARALEEGAVSVPGTTASVEVKRERIPVRSLAITPAGAIPGQELSLRVVFSELRSSGVDSLLLIEVMPPSEGAGASLPLTVAGGATEARTTFVPDAAGLWRFSLVTAPEERNGRLDEAVMTAFGVAVPGAVLEVPAAPVAAGQPVRVRVQATGALAGTVTVRVTAERLSAPPGISTGAVQVAEGLLPSGLEDPSAELAFGGGQLGSGLWRMTAKTVPAGLLVFAAESTEVRVALPRLRLQPLQPEASPVPAQNEVVIQVIVEPAPEAAVRVEVAGMLRDGAEQATRTVTVSSSDSIARAVFESGISGLAAGTWDFSARALEEGIVSVPATTASVEVERERIPVRSLAITPADAIPGQELSLRVVFSELRSSGVDSLLLIEVMPPPGGTGASLPLTVAGGATEARTTFVPDAAGLWRFSLIAAPEERNGRLDEAVMTAFGVAVPGAVLEVPAAPVAAGQPVRVRVRATGALVGTVTVRVMAERLSAPPGISTGAVQVAEGPLPSGLEDPSAELAFDGGQLGSGLWRMTAKTVPAGLLVFAAESTEVRVALPRLRLQPLQPEASPVPAQNEVVIQVIVEPAPEAAVRVEVAGMLRDGAEQATRTVTVSSSDSIARAVFESGISGLAAGTWDFSARALEEGIVSVPATTASVEVERERIPVRSLAITPADAIPGQELSLRVVFSEPRSSGVDSLLLIEVMPPPGGTGASLPLTVAGGATEARTIFVPDAAGLWRFSLIAAPEERNGRLDEAVMTAFGVAVPGAVLEVPAAPVAAGQPVRVRVRATGALASTVTVRVMAERLSAPPGISTGAVQVAEGPLPSGLEDPSAELAFDGGQLGSGLWRMTAKTVPAGLLVFAAESTEVRVALPRLRLQPLQPEASPVPAQNEVVIQVIVEPAPEAAVRVEVAGMLRDGAEQATRTVTVSSSSLSRSIARAVFESGISGLVAGTWDFSARALEEGIVSMPTTTASVEVERERIPVRSLAPTPADAIPGQELSLRVVFSEPRSSGVDSLLLIEVTPPPGGTGASLPLTVAGRATEARISFVTDAVGLWEFRLKTAPEERNGQLVSMLALTLSVDVRIDFSAPANGVDADDLVLALRYIFLCQPQCAEGISISSLTTNLEGGAAAYDLNRLRNIKIPDLLGDGIGGERDVGDILLLLNYLFGVRESLLFPEGLDEESRQRNQRILRSILIKSP